MVLDGPLTGRTFLAYVEQVLIPTLQIPPVEARVVVALFGPR
jgi:hypothetical protein